MGDRMAKALGDDESNLLEISCYHIRCTGKQFAWVGVKHPCLAISTPENHSVLSLSRLIILQRSSNSAQGSRRSTSIRIQPNWSILRQLQSGSQAQAPSDGVKSDCMCVAERPSIGLDTVEILDEDEDEARTGTDSGLQPFDIGVHWRLTLALRDPKAASVKEVMECWVLWSSLLFLGDLRLERTVSKKLSEHRFPLYAHYIYRESNFANALHEHRFLNGTQFCNVVVGERGSWWVQTLGYAGHLNGIRAGRTLVALSLLDLRALQNEGERVPQQLLQWFAAKGTQMTDRLSPMGSGVKCRGFAIRFRQRCGDPARLRRNLLRGGTPDVVVGAVDPRKRRVVTAGGGNEDSVRGRGLTYLNVHSCGRELALSHEDDPETTDGQSSSFNKGLLGALPNKFTGLATPEKNPMSDELQHEEVVVGCADGTIYVKMLDGKKSTRFIDELMWPLRGDCGPQGPRDCVTKNTFYPRTYWNGLMGGLYCQHESTRSWPEANGRVAIQRGHLRRVARVLLWVALVKRKKANDSIDSLDECEDLPKLLNELVKLDKLVACSSLPAVHFYQWMFAGLPSLSIERQVDANWRLGDRAQVLTHVYKEEISGALMGEADGIDWGTTCESFLTGVLTSDMVADKTCFSRRPRTFGLPRFQSYSIMFSIDKPDVVFRDDFILLRGGHWFTPPPTASPKMMVHFWTSIHFPEPRLKHRRQLCKDSGDLNLGLQRYRSWLVYLIVLVHPGSQPVVYAAFYRDVLRFKCYSDQGLAQQCIGIARLLWTPFFRCSIAMDKFAELFLYFVWSLKVETCLMSDDDGWDFREEMEECIQTTARKWRRRRLSNHRGNTLHIAGRSRTIYVVLVLVDPVARRTPSVAKRVTLSPAPGLGPLLTTSEGGPIDELLFLLETGWTSIATVHPVSQCWNCNRGMGYRSIAKILLDPVRSGLHADITPADRLWGYLGGLPYLHVFATKIRHTSSTLPSWTGRNCYQEAVI
ncbi:hypothetical protein BU15DRAFT_65904 [Melanogaster broomeanus]|nr:hypothetical protein BU15DRAFT_65904 [Melanogaster broomeanus]